MELQEQVDVLAAQNNQYASMVDNINHEKIALDQMLVSTLKEVLAVKKDILVKDKTIEQLNAQIQSLLGEVSELKKCAPQDACEAGE